MNESDPTPGNFSPGSAGPNGPRGPIDPRAGMAPPPPPPPGGGGGYGYPPPPPPPPKRPMFGGVTRLGGLLSLILFVFLAGFYFALYQFSSGQGLSSATYREGNGTESIAIIPVSGVIRGGTVEYVREAVQAIEKDKSIKAVVLRVQSPGGGASASDQILHELNDLKKQTGLKIVASFGDYAASGGYYVSCQSDYIFAEPTTTTGSIGVLAEVPTMQDLMEKKLGVKWVTLSATQSPNKLVANDLFRDWNAKDMAVMQHTVDSMYDRFIQVVIEGRKHVTSEADLRKIADGSVYTAQEAVNNKLVDQIGYLDAAIEKARMMGGITEKNPPVVYFRPHPTLLQMVGVNASANATVLSDFATMLDTKQLHAWLDDMSTPRVMYMFRP